MVLDLATDRAPSIVHGELVCFPDDALSRVLARLDAIEGFRGDGVPGSLYVRRVVSVRREDGLACDAWTYLFAGDARGLRPIPSGSWRAHRART
jgi:gamma-glutamylcyclotransferase (GGCT)/AIG2-like uncharacterized protein YtfP